MSIRADSLAEIGDFSIAVASPMKAHQSQTKVKINPTSVKRRPGLATFSKDGYVALIGTAAAEDEVPIFELFSQHDDEKCFRFFISGIQKIFAELRIDAHEAHIA